jgi:transposase
MTEIERRVAREARAMTRNEVIVRAIAGKLTWIQAAEICGISARHMRRLKWRWEQWGYDGLVDGRRGRPRRKRIPVETIEELCALRRAHYMDFSVQHFWEKATEEHGLKLSYTWAKLALQAAGLAEKSPGRGKYRRRRQRRAMRGMLVHLDASTHEWIPGQPMWDLVVMLDDADGRILFARFVAQEGTLSTLEALLHVVRRHGRFGELYTDRASHFCHTAQAGQAPTTTHQGQVSRALKALGIRQILARSPQARGRSERAFGTIQGRLPQELRAAGITGYAEANVYLERRFVPDFNRRFTVEPAESASAFVPLVGLDLELLLSVQQERVVQNDSTVRFEGRVLQLPPTRTRAHYVRCPVLVHQFPASGLGVSYQGQLLARYDAAGRLVAAPQSPRATRRAAPRKATVALRAPSASRRAHPTMRRNQSKTTTPRGHL